MQKNNETDEEEVAPRVTRSLRKRLDSVDQDRQDVKFVSESQSKKTNEVSRANQFFNEDVEFVSETISIKRPGVTRSLRKRLNSIDQDVVLVETPTKKALETIAEDKNVTNKKLQTILDKNSESTPTKRMTRRNSILIEESERSESPSVTKSTKKINPSSLTEENVSQLPESAPARRRGRLNSITDSEQREGTPIVVRRSARRNSITSDDGSVVSNASALRVTRSNRKSVHVVEDVLLEADENEVEEIPSTPQANLNKSKKIVTAKSPTLSPQVSTIVTRSASRSPSLPISPEKTAVTESNQSKNESLIKSVLNKSVECVVSMQDIIKTPEKVQTPKRKTPTPTKIDTPKNKNLIELNEGLKSPKFVTPKVKTPAKNEKTPQKQKTPLASRSVCFDESAAENSGIKYAQTPRSKKNQSIYEISDSSKEHSVDLTQNESLNKNKDLNQTDLIITDIVKTVTSNIGNSSLTESILPLANSNTPIRNKKLDGFNSSTPIVLGGAGKSSYLEKTPLKPILTKNISLSSGKKPKSEEKKNKTDFSKSWSQSVVNKIEVSKPIDSFGMDKEDDVIKTSPKKKNQFDSEYSDAEFEYSDGEPEEEADEDKNSYIDDEAMENNEDSMDPEERQYMEENEIPEDGISIGSEDTEAEEEGDASRDSFIVSDEEVELLEGSGDDLHNSPKKMNGSAKKLRKRIIDNTSSEDEVPEVKKTPAKKLETSQKEEEVDVKESPKKSPSKKLNISQKDKSIQETPAEEEEEEEIKEVSSDEETKQINDNFDSFLKELNASHTNPTPDEDEEEDADFVAPEEESEDESAEGEENETHESEIEEENYRKTDLKKFTGTKANQLNESVKLNKSLNKSAKQISPEVSVLNTTFSKTDEEDEVNGDEKENVDEEPTLNVPQKMLSKSKKSMTPLRKSLNVAKNSPALNKSKNLLNASTASASGGFLEEPIDVAVVKTPLKLKRDVVAESKPVTLSDVKKRCEAILHAKEASKKILREKYKEQLQEECDDKILIKRQKRKQKLEEKQRKAEEKAEIIKAFKHSKQLLIEAQMKRFAEAKEEEEDDDGYLDESEIIPSPQKKKSKKVEASVEIAEEEVKKPKKSKKRPVEEEEEETPVIVEKKKKKSKQTEVELPVVIETKKNKNKRKELEAEQAIDAIFHKLDESDIEVEEPKKKKKKKTSVSSTSQEKPEKQKKKKFASISSTSDFNVSVLETTPPKKKSKLKMLEKLSSNFVEEPLTPQTKIQSTFKESPLTPKHYNVVNIKSVATKNEKIKKVKKIRPILEPENVLPKPFWGTNGATKKKVLTLSQETHHMKGFHVEELEPTVSNKGQGFVNSAVEFKKKLAQNTAGRHTTKSMLSNMKKKKF